MKVAIVHDWLNQYGGAEQVLEVLHELYPQAPIYTSLYDAKAMPAPYRSWDIRTSFMQRLPLAKRHHQPFLPLYPKAFEAFDLSGYDLVISNSSGFCHGVLTLPQTCHINYCLTPPRFLWNLPQYLGRERVLGLLRRILPYVVASLRAWDQRAAQRVDYFVGISQAVVGRIAKFYRRQADLIYPPVDTSRFQVASLSEVSDYYLIVSRLVPYKRVDLAIEAFNRLGLPLLVIGDGRDRSALERMAQANIHFAGRVSQEELVKALSRCRALVFPGEEDFGIAPLEAMASGRPVIAYAGGGALETVVEGETGVFFREATAEALAEAVASFDPSAFDPAALRRHAKAFDVDLFKARFQAYVAEKVAEYRQRFGG